MATMPPPARPVAGAPEVLPRQAFTPWIRRVLAWFIDAIPVVVLIGIGSASWRLTVKRHV